MDFIQQVIGKMCEAIFFTLGACAAVFVFLLLGVGLVRLIGIENLNPIVAFFLLGLPLGVVTTWAVISTINDRRW